VSEESVSSTALFTHGEGQALTEPAPRAGILVVDDEPANRRLLRACLQGTYTVHDVDGASAALELLARTPIDLVLLDVMMPGMGGLELCREIKRTQPEYLPVILVTGFGRQQDRNAGLQAGADDFVTKPFDRHELLLRVRTFVRLRAQDQRIHRQLEALSEQEQLIRRQVKALEELSAMKDDLVSLMVHDLRNPLTGIAGFLDLLAEGAADPEVRSEAMEALEASGRIRETLDDLLFVRLLETSTLTLHRELVRPESIVEDAIASVRGAARARGVEISALAESHDLLLNADRKLVRRAVENLLGNALKYTPEGSTVRAAIRRTGTEVEIEVADRGCGVPEAFKQQVFQKFASVEAARGEARRGVGLGLYLVSLVATAHGGRTSVRDRGHGGAAFGLYLPGETASGSLGRVGG
jgi:signal transduction histidine kinase